MGLGRILLGMGVVVKRMNIRKHIYTWGCIIGAIAWSLAAWLGGHHYFWFIFNRGDVYHTYTYSGGTLPSEYTLGVS